MGSNEQNLKFNEIVRNIPVTEAREIIERRDICKTQKKRMDVGKIYNPFSLT